MVITETEEVITAQRVGEHKNILDMIALLDKRLSKIENDDKGTARNAIGDKSLLSKLNMDVADNRADLYYVQDELRNHCKDAHISQGQVKKWIYEKIEETTNGKD
jgi:hypothetical protein